LILLYKFRFCGWRIRTQIGSHRTRCEFLIIYRARRRAAGLFASACRPTSRASLDAAFSNALFARLIS